MRKPSFFKTIIIVVVIFGFFSCKEKSDATIKTSVAGINPAKNDFVISISEQNADSLRLDSMRQYWRSLFASVENSSPKEFLHIADSAVRHSKMLFNNDTEIMALSWFSKGFAMRKLSLFDSALICYDIAQSIYKKANLENKAINCLYHVGLLYFNKNNYEKGFEIMRLGLAKTLAANEPDTALVVKFCNYVSSKYAGILNYDSATYYLGKCEKYFVHPENLKIDVAQSTYVNLSTTYQNTGNFDKALAYLNKGLELAIELGNERKISDACYNLAYLKSEIGDYTGSNILISKYIPSNKLAYDSSSGNSKEYWASNLTDLHTIAGMNYSSLNDSVSCRYHFQKSLEYAKVAFEPHSALLAEKYINLGDYYLNFTQKWDSVLYYENMIKEILHENDAEYNVLIKDYYLPNCALAYANLGNEIKAVEFCALVIKKEIDPDYRINLENESHPLIRLQNAQKIADAYSSLYKKTLKKQYAEKSLKLYNEIDKGTDFLIANNDDNHVLKALEDNSRANKNEIALLWRLSKDTTAFKKNEVIDAFEQNKSIILKKYYKQQQLTQNKVNPLFVELRRLQSIKNELTRRSLEDSSVDLTLNKEYNYLNVKIDSFVKRIDDMMLVRNDKSLNNINFESLNTITDKTAIIDFVAASDAIYALIIYKGKYSLKRIGYTKSFEQELMHFISRLRNHNTSNKNSINLYQQLILNEFPSNKLPKDLIIIPDGELSNIPFEALVIYQDGASVHYLSDECNIRYEYCLSFLLNENSKQNANNELLAIAPKFEQPEKGDVETEYADITNNLLGVQPGLRAGFGPLKYNKAEADDISGKFSGMELVDDAATEETFRENASKFNVLHLATHAYSNPDDPNLSAIIFKVNDKIIPGSLNTSLTYKDSILEHDNILHAYEIQDLNLNANLVVLSACETGIGKYQIGEGTMSLARAFRYANCPNVVTSLWKVNDGTTKEIMTNFYENLGKGIGKADALAEAKRTFRENHLNASPSYWSAFILIGDNGPVNLKKKSNVVLWVSGMVMILGVMGLLTIRKKRKLAA
jgi:CHAT domain-containing protein